MQFDLLYINLRVNELSRCSKETMVRRFDHEGLRQLQNSVYILGYSYLYFHMPDTYDKCRSTAWAYTAEP